MKNQSRPFPLMLFCGGELLNLMFSMLAGIRAGMWVELANVARSLFPTAGWDVPIAHLDYPRFFLASGISLAILTVLWLFFCLRHSRRAPLPRTGTACRLRWAAGLAAPLFFGVICGRHLPLWEYAVLLAEGSRVQPAADFLPSAALGAIWTAAGLLLIELGARRAGKAA